VTWETVPLRAVARVDAKAVQPAEIEPDELYVGLEQISRSGALDVSARAGDANLRSAKNSFDERHVLFGKLRPNLGKVARPAARGICSTDIYPLLPSERMDGAYLYHYLRTPGAIAYSSSRTSGVNLPRVSWASLGDLSVPLPPLPEQRRIASILDEADALRRARDTVSSRLDDLKAAAFQQRFAHRRVAGAKVEGLLLDVPNAIRTGPFGSDLLHSEFVAEGIPVLGIDNVVQNAFLWARPRYITAEKYQSLRRYSVRPRDVVITIMGTVGRCAVVPEDIGTAITTKHLCCITLDHARCLPEYLHGYFLHHPTARDYLRKTSKGAIMEGLNMGIIKDLPVVLAPIDEQRDYVAAFNAIDTFGRRSQSRAIELDALFASLQHRAFRGEL